MRSQHEWRADEDLKSDLGELKFVVLSRRFAERRVTAQSVRSRGVGVRDSRAVSSSRNAHQWHRGVAVDPLRLGSAVSSRFRGYFRVKGMRGGAVSHISLTSSGVRP